MEEMRLLNEMRSHLTQLVGKTCWNIPAGKGTGSVISLDIGGKIEWLAANSNIRVSEDIRRYKGEFGIFVECAWRIDSATQVVCASEENNANDGPMVRGLGRLIGEKISSIEIALPALDMTVSFSNSLTLRVFCDQTEIERNDNYVLFFPNITYVVGPRSKLLIE